MSIQNANQEISSLRERIINYTLIIGSLLGGFTFLISLLNFNDSTTKINFLFDLIIILALIVLSILRNKVSLKLKSFVIVVGLFLLVINDVVKLGLYSDTKMLFIIIPFFSFLVYSFKQTLYIYATGVLTFLCLGYLFVSGVIEPKIDLTQRLTAYNPWIINILLISIISFIIVIIVRSFNQTFERLIRNLEDNNVKITQNEQNYREIFNASTDAIFIHDLRGKILDVNDAMLKMYGFKKNEVKTSAIIDISSGNDGYTSEKAMHHFKLAVVHGLEIFDWQAMRKTGETFWVEVALKKTHILGEECVIAMVRNIDEKKNTAIQLEKYKNKLEELVKERTEELVNTNEEITATIEELYDQKEELQLTFDKLNSTQDQLIESDKMASLGVLASGVAHEINNPLNFIRGGVIGLEGFFFDNPQIDPEDIKPLISAIDEGVDRASSIVKSLNHFSRQNDSKTEKCNLHEIIEHCLVILNNHLKGRILVTKNYHNEDLIVQGNAGKLHQAILNIITNAEQAVTNEGIVTISTKIENNKIKLNIEDNGVGISKENLCKITEPFFTTKEPGSGTGLGLSITYKIIKEHNGVLSFSSEINQGTNVCITLPIL